MCLGGQPFPSLWPKCVKSNFLQDNSTSDWSPRQAPGTEVLDVRSPASVIPCSWHTSFPQTLLLQNFRRRFPAEDTLIPLHPTQTPAGPGTLAASETRSLSTSLKSVRRGAKCTEFTDVFNLLHVLHCKRSALHCAALIWTLNCMSATWSIRAR